MSEDWKPCPFCGSADLRKIDVTLSGDDGEIDIWMIECLNCDATARVEYWNERPQP